MRKLAIFSAAFALATAFYVYLFQDARALMLAGACLVFSVLGRYLHLRRLSIAALGAAVGILWCFAYSQINLRPLDALVGEDRTVTVQVTELPRQTKYGASVEGTVDGHGVILYGGEDLLKLTPGDRATVTGTIAAAGLKVWDDESLYLRSKNMVLTVTSRSEAETVTGTPTVPQRIRMWLQNKIHLLYEGEPAGLLRALVTGDRSELSFSLQNALSVAGLSHAVAVSGLHVTMLLTMIAACCGRNPRLTTWFGIPAVALFVLMTGASPSACRAAVMQVLLLCAPLAGRENDPITTLSAAALVLLLENPWSIASVSFQLSFAAVLGLLLLSGPIQRKVLSLQKKPGRLLRLFASDLSATLGATLTTLPLAVYYFGVVSVAAPLTNLLTLWAVTGIFTLGLLSCCLGPLGGLLARLVTLLVQYVLAVVRWIAQWPFAAAYPQNQPLLVWAVCAYGLAVVLILWKRKSVKLWGLSAVTAAFLCCILWGNRQFTRYDWRLTVLDVGQGQCLLLQVGDYTAAIDCGGSYPEEAGEDLARTLHSAGVTSLDALILTHYDADHAGGAQQLLARVRVDSLFLPDLEDESGLREVLEVSDSQVFVASGLTEISVPNGEIRLYPAVLKENDNNGGVCVLATAAEYDILVTGDMDRFAEMRLLARYDLPDVELLVAGHHGSKDATSQVLLDAVTPETVVVSVGENTYGHPAEETLRRIKAAGAEVLRTDELGTVTITP